MNMLDVQDKLKNFSQDQLIREMQAPTGAAPQFMILSEITRRKRMQDAYAAQQSNQGMPTVAEEVISSAGVPRGPLPQMASAMAPKSSMEQNTGVQGMYMGGPVRKMQDGGLTSDPALRALAQRMGMSIDQLLQAAGPDQAARIEADAARRARRDRLLGLEPQGDSITFPTQDDLNQRYWEDQYGGPGPELAGGIAGDGPLTLPGMAAPPMAPSAPPRLPPDFDPSAAPMAPPNGSGNPYLDMLAASEAAGPAPAGDEELIREYLAAGVDLPAMTGAAGGPPPVPSRQPPVAPYDVITQFDFDATGPAGMPMPEPKPAMSEIDIQRARGNNDSFNLVDEASDFLSGILGTNLDPPQWFNDMVGGGEEPPTPDERREGVAPETAPAPQTAPAAPPVNPAFVGAVASGGSGGGSGGGGGGGGGGGASAGGGYISELEAALKRAERVKEQDKWLALAQTGLALMASDSPTLGGAIGEAGQVGIEAFRGARDTYEDTRMSLMQAIASQRAAAAKAAGGGGGGRRGGGGATSITDYLKGLDTFSDSLYTTTTNEFGEKVTLPIPGAEAYIEELNRRKLAAIGAGMGFSPVDLDLTQPQ